MDGKLNINYQVNNEKNESVQVCKLDVYFSCLNDKTFDKIKGSLKETCNNVANLISSIDE